MSTSLPRTIKLNNGFYHSVFFRLRESLLENIKRFFAKSNVGYGGFCVNRKRKSLRLEAVETIGSVMNVSII